jgi:hypothetical protein
MSNYGYDFSSREAQELTAEQVSAINQDSDFAQRIAAHQREILAEKRSRDPRDRNSRTEGESEQRGLGTRAELPVRPEYRAKVFSALNPGVDLAEIAMRANATKSRELTHVTAKKQLDALCDELGVPETESDRVQFRFDLILWIYQNSASGENNQESFVGEYSAITVVKFFNNDLRPMARYLAVDAETLLRFIHGHPEHPMRDVVDHVAETYGVKQTPWLAYDGVADNPAVKLTGRELALARTIKDRRLVRSADQASLGSLDRGLLRNNSGGTSRA